MGIPFHHRVFVSLFPCKGWGVSSKTHSYSKSCLFFFSRVGGGRESFACMYREGKVCAGGWGCVVNDLGKTFLSEFFFILCDNHQVMLKLLRLLCMYALGI